MEKLSYVYMMGSASRRALYTGVTGPLYKRVWELKNNLGGYFTSKYKCHRLVYYESFGHINAAIVREKKIKGWRREKKDTLVRSVNPEWKDLAADWYPQGLLKDGIPIELTWPNPRSLGPARALCPFTPNARVNVNPKARARTNGPRDDEL